MIALPTDGKKWRKQAAAGILAANRDTDGVNHYHYYKAQKFGFSYLPRDVFWSPGAALHSCWTNTQVQ